MEGILLYTPALLFIAINRMLLGVFSQGLITYGNDPSPRQFVDSLSHIVLIPIPQEGISVSGMAIRWQFYASRKGSVHLQVWRPLPSANQYRLVGRSIYTVSKMGLQTVNIDPENTISVNAGDVIGVYTPESGIITFDAWECPSRTFPHLKRPSKVQLTPGAVVSFDVFDNKNWMPCRTYSVRLSIAKTEIASQLSSLRPAPAPGSHPTADPSHNDHTGLHIKLWIGLTVLLVSAIFVVFLVVYCLRRNQSKQPATSPTADSNTQGTACSEAEVPHHPGTNPQSKKRPSAQNIYQDLARRNTDAQPYCGLLTSEEGTPEAFSNDSWRSDTDHAYSYAEVKQNVFFPRGAAQTKPEHDYGGNSERKNGLEEDVAPHEYEVMAPPRCKNEVMAPPCCESDVYLDILPSETDLRSAKLDS